MGEDGSRMIHLNHASQAVLPRASAEAAKTIFDHYAAEGSLPISFWQELITEGRDRAAKLLGVKRDSVAFVSNTTAGVHLAMQLVPFQRGDRAVVVGAFPALLSPWKFGGVDGVEPVFLDWKEPGAIIKRIETELKRGGIKAVFVDWVHFATGKVLDLQHLGWMTHEREAILVVDGIQGLGVLPSPAGSVDLLFAGAAKWLLGPEGVGLCYIDPAKRWNPGPVGWLSANYDGFTSVMPPRPPVEDARRFEAGTRNLPGIAAFSKSLEMLLHAGNVWPYVSGLIDLLIRGAHSRGLATSLQEPESGIVGIEVEQPEFVVLALHERGVRVSARERWIRVSPHFLNTAEEIAIFFAALDEIVSTR
jgi:cysteine desulfurase/selenocysteine lyase